MGIGAHRIALALAVCLALGAGPRLAAAADSAAARGWECRLCPRPEGWRGEAAVGAGWVSDSSPKFGDYRGLDSEGGFPALDGKARYGDANGRFFEVRADDLGVDSRHLALRGGERGRYRFDFDYREIPKYRGFGAQSVYLGAGGDRLVLPPGWQPAATTGGMPGLPADLQGADLEISRKTLDLGLRGRLGSRWAWDLGFEHQRKEGTRPFGAGVFTIHSSHFPAPVDFSTDRLDAGVSFAGATTHWRLGLSGAQFDNGFRSVTWPNPFAAVPGTETLRASLEPDNSYYQAALAGTWAPFQRLHVSGQAVLGRMEQDEALLAASSNPDFSEVPVPRSSADARIDIGTLNVGGMARLRLSPQWVITARLRRDERDNRTPVDLFTPIITDIAPRDPRPNRPYSFTRDRASVALRYRVGPSLRLQAGADAENNERSLQSVFETEERGYWGEAALFAGAWLEARARLERSDRDADPYVLLEDGGPVEHPLMRKFHLVDRDRRRARLELDLFPWPEFNLALAYRLDRDHYDESVIGLREAEQRSLTLDAGWSAAAGLNVHGFVSLEEIESSMASAESTIAAPWTGATRDRFFTASAGVSYSPGQDSTFGLELLRAESRGDIRTQTPSSGGAFPDLETELWNLRLYAKRAVSQRWGVLARLEYERYESSDWALDGWGPGTIPAVLVFGQDSPDYDILVLRLQAQYRF